MFLLASGFAIAKRMERTLLYYDVDKLAFKRLKPIVSAFPRTVEKFVVRYFNHSAKYLVLETNCGQNARFFEDILPEIREMYQFSDEVREQFAHLAECEKRNITCIHTRQTDFIRLNRTTDLEETVMAAYNISEQHSSQQYLIFGDDRTFMAKLATRLKQVDSSRKKTYISSHREIEDMYLSSQLCTSFLISSAMSTFGWWLAFFAPNQHSVYYMNDKRPNYSMEGIPREEMFLSSWRKYS
ncbi:hypothetical protein RB195_012966 [Necator americanus]|uniref:L-Fucosyltransferase n=1 Tax=Necator americanus TaxID=51031 RepID=A0ABR1DTC4_NECAM